MDTTTLLEELSDTIAACATRAGIAVDDDTVDDAAHAALTALGVGRGEWVVMSHDEWDDDGMPLYWNDTDGWVDLASATRYPHRWAPARLPHGGTCVPMGSPA